MSDRGLEALANMPKLSLLMLEGTKVRGSGIKHLAGLEGLNLYLEDCRLDDAAVSESLPKLRDLRLLSLSRTDITDRGVASIGGCMGLEDLRLSDTGITDKTLDLVQDLPSLQTLYVERTAVTAERIARLKVSKDLVFLYSDHCGKS
jgi:Leucine-rich repeat (LRR) protein